MQTSRPLLSVHLEGVSDAGRLRPNNEDYWGASPDSKAFAVADGVGGRRNGDVASRTAVETFLSAVVRGGAEPESLLRAAVAEANAALTWSAPPQPGGGDMATTLVGALIQGEQLFVANVGDSRAYLVRAGQLQQLTRDHSSAQDEEEARIDPSDPRAQRYASVITRALGKGAPSEPDLFTVALAPGDRVILCSDGLTRQVEDDQIRRLASRGSARKAVQDLVERANTAGGKDNVTVVIAEIEGVPDGTGPTPPASASVLAASGRTPYAGSPYGRASNALRGPLSDNRALMLAIGGGVLGLCLIFLFGFAIGRATAPATTPVVQAPQPTAVATTRPGAAAPPAGSVTPAAPATAVVAGGIHSDFKNTGAGLEAREGEQAASADGYGLKATGGASWAFFANQSFADFTAELECRLTKAVDGGACGLLFRVQDDSNWYKVSIEPQTQKVVFNSLVKGTRNDFFGMVFPAVNKGTAANRIKVVATGTTITVLVNDQEVKTVKDETFSKGQAGVIANGGDAQAEVLVSKFDLTPKT